MLRTSVSITLQNQGAGPTKPPQDMRHHESWSADGWFTSILCCMNMCINHTHVHTQAPLRDTEDPIPDHGGEAGRATCLVSRARTSRRYTAPWSGKCATASRVNKQRTNTHEEIPYCRNTPAIICASSGLSSLITITMTNTRIMKKVENCENHQM